MRKGSGLFGLAFFFSFKEGMQRVRETLVLFRTTHFEHGIEVFETELKACEDIRN